MTRFNALLGVTNPRSSSFLKFQVNNRGILECKTRGILAQYPCAESSASSEKNRIRKIEDFRRAPDPGPIWALSWRELEVRHLHLH